MRKGNGDFNATLIAAANVSVHVGNGDQKVFQLGGLNPTFRTSVCHIKSSMKKHGFLGINTCHFLGGLRAQLNKLA